LSKFPNFKEKEVPRKCCRCNQKNRRSGKGAPSEIMQVVGIDPGMMDTMPTTTFKSTKTHFLKNEHTSQIDFLKTPVPLANPRYTGSAAPANMANLSSGVSLG
jgi:hypothetical protein